MRWGKIGQAGGALSLEELERLQQIVIENSRFTEMGLQRKQALLENTTELQEHLFQIIFRQQQRILMNGLLAANAIMQDPTYDAVLAAAAIAFGYSFIPL
jgi:hypothetical protein